MAWKVSIVADAPAVASASGMVDAGTK